MKKSDKIRYIDPVTDKDLVDSIVHNRPRQDLLNNWKELRQILSRITRATGTSPHISQVPFWGNRFVIGPQDNFVAATSRLDSSFYNLYGMVAALLAASSDNITYADALAESKLRVSRKILIASTSHLVDNDAFSRILYFFHMGSRKTIPYYLSTWNRNKLSFRLGDAPIYCYSTYGHGGKINVFETKGDLDSWYWHKNFWAADYRCDYAIFPFWCASKHQWIWVRWRGWFSGQGHGCIGTPYDVDCFEDLDEHGSEGHDGIPRSFTFPTPDFWAKDYYYDGFHRYELRYARKYYRTIRFGVDSKGYVHGVSNKEPATKTEYLPFHFPYEFYRGVQYCLQLNAEFVPSRTAFPGGYGALALSFCHSGGHFGVNIFYCDWNGSYWNRYKMGWIKVPAGDITPQDNMVVTASITTIPGELDTYLLLLSAFHDDWSRNYWKKIKVNRYHSRENDEWDGSFFEPVYDEKGNLFDHKLSVASNVPMIDGKKLVVDFGAGPGEDIKGIWIRELEFRTI